MVAYDMQTQSGSEYIKRDAEKDMRGTEADEIVKKAARKAYAGTGRRAFCEAIAVESAA